MGAEAVERHEQVAHAVGPLARRAALIVSVLAAFLAVSEVLSENAVKSVITGETHVVRHAVLDRPVRPAYVAALDRKTVAKETAHSRYELAVVLLQVGIVLTSAAALIGVARLMGLGGLLGVIGVGFLIAGLLA